MCLSERITRNLLRTWTLEKRPFLKKLKVEIRILHLFVCIEIEFMRHTWWRQCDEPAQHHPSTLHCTTDINRNVDIQLSIFVCNETVFTCFLLFFQLHFNSTKLPNKWKWSTNITLESGQATILILEVFQNFRDILHAKIKNQANNVIKNKCVLE